MQEIEDKPKKILIPPDFTTILEDRGLPELGDWVQVEAPLSPLGPEQ